MTKTIHASQRMSQRGISKRMLETVMNFGKQTNDRYCLNKKAAYKAIERLQESIRCLMKIADKGGVTVVVANETYVTAWNNY